MKKESISKYVDNQQRLFGIFPTKSANYQHLKLRQRKSTYDYAYGDSENQPLVSGSRSHPSVT